MRRWDVKPGHRVSVRGHPSRAPSADTAPAERVVRPQPQGGDGADGCGARRREPLFLLRELKSATPRRGCCPGRGGVRQGGRRPRASDLGRGGSRGQHRF